MVDRQLGVEDLLLGDLMPGEQGPEPRGGRLGAVEGHLGLLDRQLVRPPLLGPWDRLEQRQRGLQAVAGGRLLGEVGQGDRLVELDDRLALLDGLALLDHELVDVPLDGRGQHRELLGDGSAPGPVPRPSRPPCSAGPAREAPRTVTWGVRLLVGGGLFFSCLRLTLLVASAAQAQTKHAHRHARSTSHNLPSTPPDSVGKNARGRGFRAYSKGYPAQVPGNTRA